MRKLGRKTKREQDDPDAEWPWWLIGIGAFMVSFAVIFGKKDVGVELLYDLGIACLIVAGIEHGLRRAVTTGPRKIQEMREQRELEMERHELVTKLLGTARAQLGTPEWQEQDAMLRRAEEISRELLRDKRWDTVDQK